MITTSEIAQKIGANIGPKLQDAAKEHQEDFVGMVKPFPKRLAFRAIYDVGEQIIPKATELAVDATLTHLAGQHPAEVAKVFAAHAQAKGIACHPRTLAMAHL